MAFKLQRQLEVSTKIPAELNTLKNDLERIARGINWTNPVPEQERQLRDRMNRIGRIRQDVEAEQIHVAEWMNMKAQQITMDNEKAECISCKQRWIQDHEYTKKEIKGVIKKINNGERLCSRCGQPLPLQERST